MDGGSKMAAGFTLIELLVVISIMGLLSSVVLAYTANARVLARDGRRIQDLHQIDLAIKLYYEDHGYYPGFQDAPFRSNVDPITQTSSWDNLKPLLAPYMKELPVDPVNNQTYRYYYYSLSDTGGATGSTNPNAYDVTAVFESSSHPLRCGLKNYMKHEFTTGSPTVPWCSADSGGATLRIYSLNTS